MYLLDTNVISELRLISAGRANKKLKIYPLNIGTANICAQIHIPNPTPENDAWIAATALQHKLTLVTRNIKDFNITDLTVLNPFE